MYYIHESFAYVPLFREWLSMFLAELASVAHSENLLLCKNGESNNDSFRLHAFELVEIDLADSFVSYLYVGVGFIALCVHCCFYLIRLEDKHPAFPLTTSNESTFFFNEAASVIEPDLHVLLHNLADRDQIHHYSWNMQNVFDVGLVALFAGWDITDMSYRMHGVISSLYIVGLFWLS